MLPSLEDLLKSLRRVSVECMSLGSAQVGVIPARYASQRFPGKPLALIAGKPMIVRTLEQAKLATSLHKLIVATDDDRIAEVCRNAGADVVMTSPDCPNGAH